MFCDGLFLCTASSVGGLLGVWAKLFTLFITRRETLALMATVGAGFSRDLSELLLTEDEVPLGWAVCHSSILGCDSALSGICGGCV